MNFLPRLVLGFAILAFTTSLNALEVDHPKVSGMDSAGLSLILISLKLFSRETFNELQVPRFLGPRAA